MDNEKILVELSLILAHDEVENVRTFVFEGKNLHWVAGQSQAYVLPQAGETEKENQRWFTIASAPTGEQSIFQHGYLQAHLRKP